MTSNGNHGGDIEAHRPLRSGVGETSKEKQEKIRHLQKEAFQLANYYFLFQGVIFTAFYSTQSHLKCRYRWIPVALSFLAGSINICSLLSIACSYKAALDDIDKLATAPPEGTSSSIAVKCASNWRLVNAAVCMIIIIAFFVITIVGCFVITCGGGDTASAASPPAA